MRITWWFFYGGLPQRGENLDALLTSLLVGIGLAMDAFAVSLGIGTGQSAPGRRSKLRLAFHFGIFQSGMTVFGWLAVRL